MKQLLQRLKPRRISSQIALLVVTSLLIAQVLTAGAFFLLSPRLGFLPPPGANAAGLAVTAKLLDSAATPEARSEILKTAQHAYPDIYLTDGMPIFGLEYPEDPMMRGLQQDLGKRFIVFENSTSADARRSAARKIGILLPDGSALNTELPPSSPPARIWPALISTIAFLVSGIALFSLWATRMLTAPLTRFASAAERFTVGRLEEPLDENGLAEISRAAKALNEMQARIRRMVDDRTEMLAAVSHDLRTPITRLRLRAEEIAPESLRMQIIRDLDGMRDLVYSALSFLKDDVNASRHVPTDVPSLIQTVCDGFVDMGRDVQFVGPRRFNLTCDAEQLGRALANLIDNGLKFGTTVRVELQPYADGAVRIDVIDDGPGIPDSEKAKVLEPFYRGDSSRNPNEQGGFGLGLSIARSVAQAHGGALVLRDGSPNGLIAQLIFPAKAGSHSGDVSAKSAKEEQRVF